MRRPMGRRHREGSQAIEFALVLPVLMLLTAGMIDYGWFFYQQQRLMVAVRDGARTGVVADYDDGPDELAEDRTRVALSEAGLGHDSLVVTATLSGNAPNVVLAVEAELEHQPLIGLAPAPERLAANLTMRLEDQPED